jgi:APA family basic amino acid/polyamine antiporter
MALTEELKVELFLRKSTGLVKEIGPVGSFILPWASMAGSGITLYAIQVIYSYPGGSVPGAFLLVGVPTILRVLTFALLGITTPRSAGGYVWTSRFVDPFVGWIGAGWIYWLAQIFSIGLVAYVMGSVYPVIFVIMGTAAGIPALTGFGTLLQTNIPMQQAFIILTIVILGLLALIEIKHYMKIMMVIWGLNTVGLIVSAILFATNNPSTIPAAWNHAWGAGSYEMITNLATKYDLAGYVSSTSAGVWTDTLAIVAYIFWALTGYEVNAYVGGELRNPRSSFLYWFTAGMIGTVIWYTVVTWLAYNAYGNFILQYNYVYNLYTAGKLTASEASAISPYMLLPSMPLFSASLGSNPAVTILAAWWFYPLTSIIVTYLAGTRCMFGMSFDRMFPSVFGKVNDRTHTPIQATIACMVGGVIVSITMFTSYGYLASAANTSFWYAFAYLMVAFTAVVLPYKRPDIWEKGTKRKILGFPEMTLVGVLAVIGMFWILALSTVGISLLAWNVSILWMLVGVLVFAYFIRKNEKRGIKMTQIFGEIPPP